MKKKNKVCEEITWTRGCLLCSVGIEEESKNTSKEIRRRRKEKVRDSCHTQTHSVECVRLVAGSKQPHLGPESS